MCGIVGVINTKEENKEIAKKIFKSLVIANETRGKDSTGVLVIDRNTNEFSLFKDTIPASTFMNRKKFRQADGDIWIGHTRWATTGEINIRNAHPLQRSNVFLVHNGVISNHRDIGTSLELEYQVDSEVLIPIVEKEDWDLLQDIKGSANFIAWNRDKGMLYVERHDNPLYCLTLKDLGIVMFSSIKEVLTFISSHYSSGDEVYEFEEDLVVRLDMNGNLKDKIELNFPIVVPPTTYKYSNHGSERYPVYNNYEEWSAYQDDYEYTLHKLDEVIDGKEGVRVKKNDKILPFLDDEDEVEDLWCEVCGCEICEDEAEFGNKEWGFPLCYSCLTELDVANDIIRDTGTIDLKSGQWAKFSGVLEYYIK